MLENYISRLYIDGVVRPAEGGRKYANLSPVTAEAIGFAAEASTADMDSAIDAARRAFDSTRWPADRKFRASCLERFRDALRARRDSFRTAAQAEVGAPAGILRGSMCDHPLDAIDYWIDMIGSYPFEERLPITETMIASHRLIVKEAAGVVAAITPWNFPLQINMAKCFPALAAGCTVVLKAAPETPWIAGLMGEAAADADMPPGVFNVITSSSASDLGEQLVADSRVDMISFTGSTATGRRIMEIAARDLKRVFLELGGKSANIALDDADIDAFAARAPMFVLYHAGQGCACLTRVLVPRRQHDEYVRRLRGVFEAWRYDDPSDPTQVMGPLISERHRRRVLEYIRIGRDEGATLVAGGHVPANMPRGFYVEPTLFANVGNGMRIAQEEIFGPVLCVIPHDGDDDAVRIANQSPYGLSGAVWARSESRALAVARRLRTGTVNINDSNALGIESPFGGYKQSGIGREMGRMGFEEYLETKVLATPVNR